MTDPKKMSATDSYRRWDMVCSVLAEEMNGIEAALKRMEKPAADMAFGSAETLARIAAAHRALMPLKSAIQKHKYAKVSFR